MVVLRLSTLCPDLEAALRSASRENYVQTGWAVAQWAVHQTSLSHPAISAARIGGPTDGIAALVGELDERYFELQERCEKGECSQEDVVAAFGRARAANAVEFAVRGEAAEAVYEAAVCCDNVSGLRRVFGATIGSKTDETHNRSVQCQ